MTPEEGYRWRKVARLMAALYVSQVPPVYLAQLQPDQWALVARVGKVNTPSETTLEQLGDMLVDITADLAKAAVEDLAAKQRIADDNPR